MDHKSAAMTVRYTGKLPLAQIQADFSKRKGPRIVVLENKENEGRLPYSRRIGAGEGNRTLTYSLGSYRSTTELLPLGWNKLENSTRLAARARIVRSVALSSDVLIST